MEDDSEEDFNFVSDYFVDSEECLTCAGTGKVTEESEKVCPTCDGEGCVIDGGDNILVCPECRGHEHIVAARQVSCSECDGRGARHYLARTAEHEMDCPECNGHGEVKVAQKEYSQCRDCGGEGFLEKTISMQEFANGGVEYFKECRVKECPACSSQSAWECEVCGGDEVLYVVFPLCPSCKGSKEISKVHYESEQCNSCDGTGRVTAHQTIRSKEVSKNIKSIASIKEAPTIRADTRSSDEGKPTSGKGRGKVRKPPPML